MEENRWNLDGVRVRPVRDPREHQHWDRLMAAYHDLSFQRFYGRALRHVAVCGESWLALVGGSAGAFRVGARDRWSGGSDGQRERASASGGQPCPVPGSRLRPEAESGLAGAGPAPAPAVAGPAEPAWRSGAAGRDVRGRFPVFRHLLPGRERAASGVDLGLFPGARRGARLAIPWATEGGVRVPATPRCRRPPERRTAAGGVPAAGAAGAPGAYPAVEPVRAPVAHRGFPQGARPAVSGGVLHGDRRGGPAGGPDTAGSRPSASSPRR